MPELKYWLWLSSLKGISAKDKVLLIDRFGSPRDLYFARDWEYSEVISGSIEPLLDKNMARAEEILNACERENISILTLKDSGYPERLKNIYDPPVLLYIKGKLPPIDDRAAIAIVGTRSCTPYGIVMAERMAYEIARGGGLVITGLARGVDAAAAQGALRGNGKVVGVLGCGVDVVYPPSNRRLFQDVETVGALISEYPPGAEPLSRHFPVRNRIISGLSVGVLVIEAPIRSGALITAARALEQGRDVFVVPGNADSAACRGSNELLREGASVALSGRDILDEYSGIFNSIDADKDFVPLDRELVEKLVENQRNSTSNRKKDTKKIIDNGGSQGYIDLKINRGDMSPEEIAIIEAMNGNTVYVDDIILKSGLTAAQVLAGLTVLEIKGAVTREPGKRYTPHVTIIE